eukprot:3311733-Rhodomonas_salina.1
MQLVCVEELTLLTSKVAGGKKQITIAKCSCSGQARTSVQSVSACLREGDSDSETLAQRR